MNSNPLISIIVPVYNDEKFVRACLDSILSQDFEDYEIILINDGSKDGSPEICDEYQKKYDKIKFYSQKNSGLSVTRNNGISYSSGKYVFFVDSDDFLTRESALTEIASSLNKCDTDIFVIMPEEYDEEGKTVIKEFDKIDLLEDHIYNSNDICDSLYREKGVWVTQAQTKLFKKDFINRNDLKFTEGIYHEDDEWLADAFLTGCTVAFLFRPLYGRRVRANSITTSTDNTVSYKRSCDKAKVGMLMFTHPNAKKHPQFLIYSAEYYFNAVSRANKMKAEDRTRFISYLEGFKKSCKKIISPKAPKQSAKAMYILTFGIEKFINHYEGT